MLIISAEVVKEISNKTCNFWNGDYMSFRNLLNNYESLDILQREGSFGYNGGRIWVDYGCSPVLRVCVTGNVN